MTKYIPTERRYMPETLRFDVPRHNQGQIVEVAYADARPEAAEACGGSKYKRVTDGSTGRVEYYVRQLYTVIAPRTPGATPSWCGEAETVEGARDIARKYADRPDLRGQDVRIEDSAGQRVAYAGPSR